MSDLEIRLEGFDELAGRLRRAPERAEKHFHKAGDRSAIRVQASAKERAPKKTRTLARSINWRRLAKFVWAVGTNLIYARIHEQGGTITPKKSAYLVFQVGGRWVKTKSVYIPARPYMEPALRESTGYVEGQFRQAAEQLLSETAG